MRKLLSFILSFSLIFALCACGSAPAAVESPLAVPAAPAELASPRGYIEDKPAETEAPAPEPIIAALPLELCDGLVLESIFASDVMNPDCGGSFGTDIATAEIVNTSDRMIESAEISVILSDGSALNFLLSYIPAGRTVWAFSVDNAEFDSKLSVTDAVCEAVYADSAELFDDKLSVSVSDLNIILNNKTSAPIADAAVSCHCIIDDVIFGGTVFTYPTDEIAAFSGTIIEAFDCMLGTPEVVHIDLH